MVRELFGVTPDPWQHEALEAFPHAPRLAMKACTGPGKTCLLAWVGWNFLLTRPHPVVGAASINGANLYANLWPELARWRAKSEFIQRFFEQTQKVIFYRPYPATWHLQARTWAQDANVDQMGNALRGLHGEYVLWLLDETGGYPDGIMPTVEGIFSGAPIEAHIVQAGNPTHLSGPLYRACTTALRHWRVIEITADPDDPKRSSRISVEHARAQIELYGRDNPWVRVNIFGQFPQASPNALIGPDEMSTAMARYYREHEIGRVPKILGVDVAWYGDDASVIWPREGIQSYAPIKYRGIGPSEGAGQIVRKWDDWQADAVFIDGSTFGAGWVENLRLIGKIPFSVQFGGAARDKLRYANKRAEMYFDAVQWIRRGGALPQCPELTAALTQTTYAPNMRGQLVLEPKESVKKKIGFSPDDADAFVLSFAEPVTITDTRRRVVQQPMVYDPFAELDGRNPQPNRYDPFRAA